MTSIAAPLLVSCEATSKPVRSGSCTSSSTTSGWSAAAASTALSPSLASPTTSNPSASSSARALARKLGWSSTISTLVTYSMVAQRCACIHTASHTLSPALDPEPLQHRFVPAPFRAGLDAELEEDPPPEERLDLGTGACADLAHHAARAADDDLLLRLGLDVDHRPHRPLDDLLDLDRDRVRQLVAGQLERLLADELGDLHVVLDVRAHVGREVERPFRQELHELVAELADAVAGLRAHGMQRLEVAERRSGVHLLGNVPGLEPVDLVERDHDPHAEGENAFGDEAVAAADPVAAVEHEQHALDVLERPVDGALQVLGQQVARLLEAGPVGE